MERVYTEDDKEKENSLAEESDDRCDFFLTENENGEDEEEPKHIKTENEA